MKHLWVRVLATIIIVTFIGSLMTLFCATPFSPLEENALKVCISSVAVGGGFAMLLGVWGKFDVF